MIYLHTPPLVFWRVHLTRWSLGRLNGITVCSGTLSTAYDGLGDAVFLKTSAGGVGGRVCPFSTLGCYQNKKM